MRVSGPGFLWGVPVLGGLFTLVTVVILAWVGGRLLGIRVRRRAILPGFPGLVLGWIAAWSINGQRAQDQAGEPRQDRAPPAHPDPEQAAAYTGQDHDGDQGEQPAEHRDTPQKARPAQPHRPSPPSAIGLHKVRNHRVSLHW